MALVLISGVFSGVADVTDVVDDDTVVDGSLVDDAVDDDAVVEVVDVAVVVVDVAVVVVNVAVVVVDVAVVLLLTLIVELSAGASHAVLSNCKSKQLIITTTGEFSLILLLVYYGVN